MTDTAPPPSDPNVPSYPPPQPPAAYVALPAARRQLPPPAAGERMPTRPDPGLLPAVVVASFCLWIAYLLMDAIASVGPVLSLPSSTAVTPRVIGGPVGALVLDVAMLVFALVMLRARNWARIALAVLGSVRFLSGLFVLIGRAGNAAFWVDWGVGYAILLLLLAAAFVTMFPPAANAWFALGGQAGQRHGIYPYPMSTDSGVEPSDGPTGASGSNCGPVTPAHAYTPIVDRVLRPRDRGPVKAYVRDVVDSRRHLVGLFMPVAALVFVSLVVPFPRLQSLVSLFCMATLVIILAEGMLLGWRVTNKVRGRFPEEQVGLSVGWYAFNRAAQLRKLRVPKPRVNVGDAVPDHSPQAASTPPAALAAPTEPTPPASGNVPAGRPRTGLSVAYGLRHPAGRSQSPYYSRASVPPPVAPATPAAGAPPPPLSAFGAPPPTHPTPPPAWPADRRRAEMEAMDLLALIFALFGGAILAVIFGAVGRNRARKRGLRQHPVGVVGLIFGWIELGAYLILICVFLAAGSSSGYNNSGYNAYNNSVSGQGAARTIPAPTTTIFANQVYPADIQPSVLRGCETHASVSMCTCVLNWQKRHPAFTRSDNQPVWAECTH